MTNRGAERWQELGSVSGDATLAEMQGMTAELGEAIARLAEEELEAGRLGQRPDHAGGVGGHEPQGRGRLGAALGRPTGGSGQPLAARFCAEVAARLAPADPWVRLTRAESLLGTAGASAPRRRSELAALAPDGTVGPRAQSLLAALGAVKSRAAERGD